MGMKLLKDGVLLATGTQHFLLAITLQDGRSQFTFDHSYEMLLSDHVKALSVSLS